MKIKEIHAKTGQVSNYFGYIILLFGWYFINNFDLSSQSALFEEGLSTSITWVLKFLVSPIIFAVVFGGIYERQTIQSEIDRNSFFGHIKLNFWRLTAANILSIIFYFTVSLIAVLLTGYESESTSQMVLIGLIITIISAINLFWFAGVVVERKIFQSLAHAIKTLLTNPVAFAIGLVWIVFGFADTYMFDFNSEQVPLAINLARSGVFAVLRVLATMYILVIYHDAWGGKFNAMESMDTLGRTTTARPGEKLASVSLGFTWVSFLPVFHLFALILGAIALKRSPRFQFKAAVACWMGGFFTIFYALIIAGVFVNQSNPLKMPDYAFLAVGNAEAEPYVALLGQGATEEIQAQLGNASKTRSDLGWQFYSALALSKYDDNNLNGALQDFYTALKKNPDRSEFYFYYGLALLDNDNPEMALEQFQLASQHEPKLEIANQYIALLKNAYHPDKIVTALMSILVLCILFALHEYGHAFAAWKLGDDTAKNLGRLTLNPIAHLDLFGSILLPGLLLLQQSGVMFGWAKPVPVNTANFKNPNKDHMLVSFAGPMVNLMISMVCLVLMGLILLSVRILWPDSISMNLANPYSSVSLVGSPFSKWILIAMEFLKQLFFMSLLLGFFNLLPIPPLDGSWILSGMLPEGQRVLFERIRPFGFMIFFLLVMTPVFGYFLGVPIRFAYQGLDLLFYALGFV